MSRNLLLATVAATALIAGGSIASAQGMSQKSDAQKAEEKKKPNPTNPQDAQKSESAPKAKQDAQKSESAPKAKQDAQKSESPPKAKSETTGQAPREGQGGGMQRQEGQSGQTGQDRREGQSEQRRDGQGQQRQEGQRQDNQRQDGQRQGQNERSNTQLTSEQRTKISTVVKSHSEARVSNVNFAVSVGTVVPRTVKIVALPEEVIVIHPAWRGYRFFIVNDQIVIVEPDSLRIVAVIPA
jgi:type IV secretory pathway VirB10-like protein